MIILLITNTIAQPLFSGGRSNTVKMGNGGDTLAPQASPE